MSKLHGIPFWKCDVRIVSRSEPCNLINLLSACGNFLAF